MISEIDIYEQIKTKLGEKEARNLIQFVDERKQTALDNLATKDDVRDLQIDLELVKANLLHVATKEELEKLKVIVSQLATKEEVEKLKVSITYLATKEELERVRTDVEKVRTDVEKLRTDSERARLDMTRWFIAVLVALLGMFITMLLK